MRKCLPLFLIALAFLPLALRPEKNNRQSKAALAIEYGLDALERRYYHPAFRFDFPAGWGDLFSEVRYLSRMNGRLQGAIDYWANIGVRKNIGGKLALELRLNHFCRHETVRDTSYIWNMNEVLARAEVADEKFSLGLGLGGFIGGSEGYRELALANGAWHGFIIPELSLVAEVKLVNFARLYHEGAVYLALNKAIDLFFKNVRHYEFRTISYIGLRCKSAGGDDRFLRSLKVQVAALPFHDVVKTEVAGGFRLDFISNPSRRVAAAVDFEAPILKGDGFLAQFWPEKMVYDITLDYERRIGAGLFAAWTTRYRLDLPVDEDLPFAASLFTGLALRNQGEFDEWAGDFRYDLAAGYDFKHGLEFNTRIGMGIWKSNALNICSEIGIQAVGSRIRMAGRVLAGFGRRVQLRPFIGVKKDIPLDASPETAGKLLFGLVLYQAFF